MFSRTNTTNLGTSNARFIKCNVNGVNGLVLFPQGYQHPDIVNTTPSNINSRIASYSNNTFSTTDWAAMEAAGAVFLPAAGWITSGDLAAVNSKGVYWTSTVTVSPNVSNLFFYGVGIEFNGYTNNEGHSVRLVWSGYPSN